MKKVVILSGIPGCGKTHYAQSIVRPWGMLGRVVSTDYFWGEEYEFDPNRIEEAHIWCFKKFLMEIEEMMTSLVVVDNTNLSAMEIAPYYLAAQAFSYEPVVQRILCPPHIAWERQSHGVPQARFQAMVDQFNKRDVAPWWRVEEI